VIICCDCSSSGANQELVGSQLVFRQLTADVVTSRQSRLSTDGCWQLWVDLFSVS